MLLIVKYKNQEKPGYLLSGEKLKNQETPDHIRRFGKGGI
jgi:hypothetical protein